MAFVWCGFKEIGASALFMNGGKTASCTTLMRWAKSNGQWVTSNYKRGDVFLFQFDADDLADHTGIFTGAMSGTSYICIEGNTNDRVCRVARQPGIILGAYRPRWDSIADEPADKPAGELCSIKLPLLRFGSKGEAARTLQQILIAKGYYCGPDGADGDFGAATELALKNYQSDRGLEADGVCGEDTYTSLFA